MTIIWSENAKDELNNYKQNSKIPNVIEYINELIEYVSSLQNNPEMGKLLFSEGEIEVRQLIFRMHRIFYVINDKNIIITNITHTKRNINFIIKYLNRYLKR